MTTNSDLTGDSDWMMGDPISDDVLKIVMFVNYGVIVGVISSTGVIFNLVNIAVFLKQGFRDPINISLVGLAVADTGGLVCLIWMSLCYNPLVVDSLERLDLVGIQHITAGWPHVCFTRITGWLTVFITFERYLCIAFPLKVKAILTPRRTVIVVVLTFSTILASAVPVYVAIHIDAVFNFKANQTTFTIVYIHGGQNLENASMFLRGYPCEYRIHFCSTEMMESSAKVDVNETAYVTSAGSDPISDDLLHLVMFINYGVIVGVISSIGVALNIINIVVFTKQGFKDAINIPLVGLAVADTGGVKDRQAIIDHI
ncbi:uncharacterized protein LOC131934666 [Physella acuta]|uniref:uncharacterized protein LOC131934666 n=1 Tax=Physella acuta TaxID=109671 RepID=UPI0027DC746B|nr:uncharacterized protein LOC131934666 [Physella acuta]